ncbi:hypothetical protein CD351_08625 [Erythrobacter sp. KY5]|uniref:DUF3137 domain-containing protein n=1 Tax=Erythrobacter sp. KY5 TaxID=2011159 RepID=UPI000DBEFD6F|nr:DUF3137 domain-containing protein [Erythrobacter sp. KY5]AWW74488.1 hypothetical protein CD351_08625 [Erythrobacter sp. KY5]
MQADIQRLLDGELGQWLAEQEAVRAEAKAKARDRWFYGALICLPLFGVMWFLPVIAWNFKIFIAVAACGAAYAWGYAVIAEAKKNVKVGINSAIAADLGIRYDHEVSPGWEYDTARKFSLLPSSDRRNFEDRWFGELSGHRFNLYEAHLEERRGSGKNRRWVTVFRGAIIDMGFGRDFHSTTLLQRKGKHKKWWGFGGRADHVTFDGHRLDFVDQVHPDFEDVFEVYSDDQVEARVLIHPSYVEHLLELERVFGGDAVRAVFSAGELVIVVESGNLFESGTMNARDDRAKVAQAAEQFGAMARLALAINQNERGRVMISEG